MSDQKPLYEGGTTWVDAYDPALWSGPTKVELLEGAWIAQGYVSPASSKARPVKIPAEHWRFLERSGETTAAGGGIEYIGLVFSQPPPRGADARGDAAGCARWLEKLMQEGPKQKNRDQYLEDAQQRFGVTGKSFKEKFWPAALRLDGVHPSWHKRGPISNK